MVVANYSVGTSVYAVGHACWRCQQAYPDAAIVHPVFPTSIPGMNHSCVGAQIRDVDMGWIPRLGGQPELFGSRIQIGNPESSGDPVVSNGVQA